MPALPTCFRWFRQEPCLKQPDRELCTFSTQRTHPYRLLCRTLSRPTSFLIRLSPPLENISDSFYCTTRELPPTSRSQLNLWHWILLSDASFVLSVCHLQLSFPPSAPRSAAGTPMPYFCHCSVSVRFSLADTHVSHASSLVPSHLPVAASTCAPTCTEPLRWSPQLKPISI